MSKGNVLVTGGAGFIGSHACLALHEAGYTPVVLDNLSAGKPERVQWGPLLVGDIRDGALLDKVLADYKPIAAMHFAALIAVGESVRNPAPTYDVNVGGTVCLLNALRRNPLKALVFSSTAAVYGTPEVVPIAETAPTQPINPYGQSKLMMEHMLADFHAAYGMGYAALRYFNAAGATAEKGLGYQRPDPTHLIPLAMLAMVGKAPPLTLFGDDYSTPDGTAVRDYLHVRDLAAVHVLALEKLLASPTALVCNLGTGRGYSVREVVDTIERVTGVAVPHSMGPRREGDPAALVAFPEKVRLNLNWTPQESDLDKIINDDWQWHRRFG